MVNISDLDIYFQNHPLQQQYFQFPSAVRTGAAAVASRDMEAALGYRNIPEELTAAFTAAVAEQALFLLLNPEYLTGTAAPTLGARPRALLEPLLARIRAGITRVDRG